VARNGHFQRRLSTRLWKWPPPTSAGFPEKQKKKKTPQRRPAHAPHLRTPRTSARPR